MIFDIHPPQTPALVIDRNALMQNLKAMQSACDVAGIRLRPHGKMHKCSTLGLLQVELGAVGLCCQTVGEAESMVRGGIKDVLVSAPVPPWGPTRLAALASETGARVAVVCDSMIQIERLGDVARQKGIELDCLIDIDIGMRRAGCSPSRAPQLAALASQTSGLRYQGIQAYFGDLQHAENRAADNDERTATLKLLVVALTAAGLEPEVITGGGTGTFALDTANGVFTELQCGSYAVMDSEYGACNAPVGEWPFRPALFIAASVVSAQHASHVTIDAGLKAISADVPPRIVAGAVSGSQWRSMGDEHSAIIHPAEASGRDQPREGDIVWLQPGHCDPTINLYDAFYVTREEGGLDQWPIDARRVSA